MDFKLKSMKKLMFFLIILSNLISYSQEIRNTDRFFFNSQKYNYLHFSWGQSSCSKPFKIIVCSSNDLKTIETNLRICQKFKLEYTDYYILSLTDISKSRQYIKIIKAFLLRVDEKRIAKNLSRVIVRDKMKNKTKFNIETKNFKEVFDATNLNDVEDLYINIKPELICNTVRGLVLPK